MKTQITLTITHARPIDDVVEKVAARAYTLDGVDNAEAVGQPADPMEWPLPCDVTVGHGTMQKGVKLRTLVTRMKALYKLAIGQDADAVANRSLEERVAPALSVQTLEDQHGWKLVPINPTLDMQCRGMAMAMETSGREDWIKHVWGAMLAAAINAKGAV